jgi:hypothetical protein
MKIERPMGCVCDSGALWCNWTGPQWDWVAVGLGHRAAPWKALCVGMEGPSDGGRGTLPPVGACPAGA